MRLLTLDLVCVLCVLVSSMACAEAPEMVEHLSSQMESAFGLDPTDRHNAPGGSFEEAKAGEFDQLDTAIGTWTPDTGRTIISIASIGATS